MSNLTDLLPAGAGGKQVSFVASGTIGNGVTVALKADGTVEAVASVSQATGSPVVFEAANTRYESVVFDSLNNKIVIAYQDDLNSDYGTAVVGTVSGSSISFGTPVIFRSARSIYTSAVFDSNSNKVVVSYEDQGGTIIGNSNVGTVSGSSISFGAVSSFTSNRPIWVCSAFDSNLNKVVVAYKDVGNLNYGTAVVGTVSGTTISFGSPVVFETANSDNISITFDSSSNQVIISYRDLGNSNYGTSIVGAVSGTSISFGSAVVFSSSATTYNSTVFCPPENKSVIFYTDNGDSNYGKSVVGSVSGTAISFGTPVNFSNSATGYIAATFDSSANKIAVSYQNSGNLSYGTVVAGTVSDNSMSFQSSLVFETADTRYISSAFDANSNKVVIGYADSGNFSHGTAVVYTTPSTNSADFIGISDAAISDTASGSVTIKGGISTNVTGLTANSTYYVQTDGSLSTTASDVLAGKALSSTSINLDYTT
jgi:hypothetical protein